MNYPRLIFTSIASLWLILGTMGVSKHELIVALTRYFSPRCVFLLVSASETSDGTLLFMKELVLTQIHLSTGDLPTAAKLIKANDSLLSFTCTSRPLNIVLSSNNSTQQYLQQVFMKFDSSESRWLLFLENNTAEQFLASVFIPFDCEFLTVQTSSDVEDLDLIEVYRVKKVLQVSRWGRWTKKGGLEPPVTNIFQRRKDLQGSEFMVAAIHRPPFVFMKKNDGRIEVSGICWDILLQMSNILNFSITIFQSEKVTFGKDLHNGSWDGAIGLMQSGTTNLTVNKFYIVEERISAVDYSLPISKTKFCLFIRTPESKRSPWTSFLVPLKPKLWMAIGIHILILSCVLSLLHYIERWCTKTNLKDFTNQGNPFLSVWGSYCQQGSSIQFQTSSARFVHWMCLLVGIVILYAYSAQIISSSAIERVEYPFTSLEGLLDEGSYGFVLFRYSPLYASFKESSEFVAKGIFKKMPPSEKLPKSPLDVFHTICKKRVAAMEDCSYLAYYYQKIPCDVSVLPDASFPMYEALPFPKHSPYKGLITFWLQKMMYSGSLRRIINNQRPQHVPSRDVSSLISAEFDDVASFVNIYSVSLIIIVLLLFLEIIFHRKRKIKKTELSKRRKYILTVWNEQGKKPNRRTGQQHLVNNSSSEM